MITLQTGRLHLDPCSPLARGRSRLFCVYVRLESGLPCSAPRVTSQRPHAVHPQLPMKKPKDPKRYPKCAVRSCTRPGHHGFSRYCNSHAERLNLYGHPTARPLTKAEAEHHRRFVEEVFARRRDSKAMLAGLEIAYELLHYVPRMPLVKWDREVAEQMARLRDRGATPWELLRCVCEVLALEYREPVHFTDPKVATYALARRVTMIRQWPKGWRPTGRFLKHLGELLREHLGVFALRVIQEGERIEAERVARLERIGGEW